MPYHTLEVFRKAYQAALEIHRLSLKFPKFEQFEIARQLRESTKSIAANIAEGMGKQESYPEVRRYVRIAIGSCDETKVWLEFAKDLGYLNPREFEKWRDEYNTIGKMLRGILRRYK